MYRGGMIMLNTHAVWVLVGNGSAEKVLQITDATFLARFGSSDVTILETPLGFVPDIEMFKSRELPPQIRRLTTSAPRSLGSEHLDRPLGRDEMIARGKLVTKTINRITHCSGGGSERRSEMINKFGRQLNELMTTCGSDEIVARVVTILAENPSITPAAAMRALEVTPTMNQRLGIFESLEGSGGGAAPARPSRALAALGFTAGARPGAFLHAELSDPRSVAPHAILRFLERIEGRISPEMVDASRQILRAKHSGVGVEEARRRLTALKTTKGLDSEAIQQARQKLTELVSDAADAQLSDRDRPVIAGRPTANLAAEADRVILSLNYEGRRLEILVRAARVICEPGRPANVAVEILTLWEPATVLASKLLWSDPSVPDALAEEWNRATEHELYSAIAA
jgi:hypothetical protein